MYFETFDKSCVPSTHTKPPFHTWTTLTQTAPVAGAFGRQAELVGAVDMTAEPGILHSTQGFRECTVKTVGVRWFLRAQISVDGACE